MHWPVYSLLSKIQSMSRSPLLSQQPDKAYKNLEFLNSPAARSIRVQCELTEPADRFRHHKVNNTVVIFGSARTLPQVTAEENLEALKSELRGKANLTKEESTALKLAETRVRTARYYEDAVKLSRLLTQWSQSLEDVEKRFLVCSGGGPGIMEAANRGANEAGGESVALGISLPFEQGVNGFATPDLSFEFHYFFVRKYWFLYLAKALITFPGGFGTMDELFEMLTLIQTSKVRKQLPIILYDRAFWDEIVNFDALVKWGVISESDLMLFKKVDSVEEAMKYLKEHFADNYLKADTEPEL